MDTAQQQQQTLNYEAIIISGLSWICPEVSNMKTTTKRQSLPAVITVAIDKLHLCLPSADLLVGGCGLGIVLLVLVCVEGLVTL